MKELETGNFKLGETNVKIRQKRDLKYGILSRFLVSRSCFQFVASARAFVYTSLTEPDLFSDT